MTAGPCTIVHEASIQRSSFPCQVHTTTPLVQAILYFGLTVKRFRSKLIWTELIPLLSRKRLLGCESCTADVGVYHNLGQLLLEMMSRFTSDRRPDLGNEMLMLQTYSLAGRAWFRSYRWSSA